MQKLPLNQLPTPAFTTPYPNKVRILRTDIGVSPYKKDKSTDYNPEFKGRAIWDTGASGSVIAPKVASTLKLKPIGKKKVQSVNGISRANEYLVNIYLPNRVQIVGLPVIEAGNIVGHFDVLIGMDIITLGDFAVTNQDNKTKLSFQMPSTHDIDFVKEIMRVKQEKQIKEKLKRDRAEYDKAHRKPKKKKKKKYQN